jgi:hypothetical protein
MLDAGHLMDPDGARDAIGVYCGDPHEPYTIAGFNMKMAILAFEGLTGTDFDDFRYYLGMDGIWDSAYDWANPHD